jgi:hypothetical protein
VDPAPRREQGRIMPLTFAAVIGYPVALARACGAALDGGVVRRGRLAAGLAQLRLLTGWAGTAGCSGAFPVHGRPVGGDPGLDPRVRDGLSTAPMPRSGSSPLPPSCPHPPPRTQGAPSRPRIRCSTPARRPRSGRCRRCR